jgi:2-hydroxy-3-keto-5-methylthiopentenyl-1-phosphate phosphatase
MATGLDVPLDRRILVSDFDGTMTRRDFYQLVQERLSPHQGTADWWGEYQAGRLSHFEALRQIFGAYPAGEAELIRLAHDMELDQDLAASVTALRAAGWEVVVASAGCVWYIRLLLNEAGVDLPVHANPGHIEDGRLVMERPTSSAFQSPRTGIDKVAVVRAAQQGGRIVAFAGDGPPDLEPALLVPAPVRFARGYLADALRSKGENFNLFERWSDIAPKLCKDSPSPPAVAPWPQ